MTHIKKKIFCCLLCFTFIMRSLIFGSVISDNDGSAFVTKSEFDAMRVSFDEQITSYEQSITGKIDGAIAQYLAGIKIATDIPINNYIQTLTTDYDLKWNNGTNGYLTTKPLYKQKITVRLFAEAVDVAEWKNVKQYSGMATQTIDWTDFLKMPVCNTASDGKVTVGYYEERQTYITMDGYWCHPRVSQDLLKNGTDAVAFDTEGFNQMLQYKGVNPCKNKTVWPNKYWNGYNGIITGSSWAGGASTSMVVTGTCNVQTQNKDDKYILINTNSAAKTYYFNLDNETEGGMDTGGKETSEAALKFDDANWQTMTGGTTGGTHLSGAASTTGMAPKVANVKLPWSQNQMVSQDMYDSRIKLVTGKTKPLKEGVCMFDITQVGTLTFRIKVDGPGTVRVFAFKGSDESNLLYDNTQTYAAYDIKPYTLDTEVYDPTVDDPVQFWVMYIPTTTIDQKLEVLDAKIAVIQ